MCSARPPLSQGLASIVKLDLFSQLSSEDVVKVTPAPRYLAACASAPDAPAPALINTRTIVISGAAAR
jgi:hypothetical protein